MVLGISKYNKTHEKASHKRLYPVHAKSLQSCPTLCDPKDCSPPGSSVYGESPGKNTGVGSHSLLQGIFLTQGSNRGLLHCRQTLYHLSLEENENTYIYG